MYYGSENTSQNLTKLFKLRNVIAGREEHELIAPCLRIAAHKAGNRLGRGEQPRRDALGKRACKGVIIPQILPSRFAFLATESEVALRPQLRSARASGVVPCGASLV